MPPPPHAAKVTKHKNIKKKVPYSNEVLMKALDEVRFHGKSLRKTAKAFGIPPATLHDRITRKRSDTLLSKGPDPILGIAGENSVKEWVISIAKCGFPVKKEALLDTVQSIVKDNGTKNPFKDNRPGQTWYRSFLKRHPDLSVRIAKDVKNARITATEESIIPWFGKLETFLAETNNHDILNCPERIFSADITCFSMCPKTGMVLGPKGYRNSSQVKSGNEKEILSVLLALNAVGKICPPLIVFPYVEPPQAVVESLPEDWCLGKTEKGCMRADVFFEYITNDFDKWVECNQIKKPVLLLIDGHRSHMSLVLSTMCERQQIILYSLPPNATHILQPAEVSIFGPMKSSWKAIVRNVLSKSENIDSCVTNTNICKLLKEILIDKTMEQNIIIGFKLCGLYPFNPNAVDYTKCVQDFGGYLYTRPTDSNIVGCIPTENYNETCSAPTENQSEISRSSENLNVICRTPSENCNETSNQISDKDLVSAIKVLKYLKPVLKKKKMSVSAILNEVQKLLKP